MSKLRVALVGCGVISEAHLRAYLAHADRAEIVVCCDPVRERAEARAAQAGCRSVTDFRAVLDDPGVDSVDLLTPHALHRDQTIAALEAGKHVLLQKILARNLAECDDILAAEKRANTTLFYGEMNRTSPATVMARDVVASGGIGQVIGTQSTYAHWQGGAYLETKWRYDPAEAGGGQLMDGGIHQIATMETVVGPIVAANAMTTRFRPELGGEDTAAVGFEYECGAPGTYFSSHAGAIWPPGPHFMAMGSEALLAIGGPHGLLTLHHRKGHEVLIKDHVNIFETMIRSFLDVVQEGAPNPSTAAWGKHQMEVVLAAYRSAETGIRQQVSA